MSCCQTLPCIDFGFVVLTGVARSNQTIAGVVRFYILCGVFIGSQVKTCIYVVSRCQVLSGIVRRHVLSYIVSTGVARSNRKMASVVRLCNALC